MTEVSMAGIARLAGKLWVGKATTSATTPLSETSIWPTEECCGCTGLAAAQTVCKCMNMKHSGDETDQKFIK